MEGGRWEGAGLKNYFYNFEIEKILTDVWIVLLPAALCKEGPFSFNNVIALVVISGSMLVVLTHVDQSLFFRKHDMFPANNCVLYSTFQLLIKEKESHFGLIAHAAAALVAQSLAYFEGIRCG